MEMDRIKVSAPTIDQALCIVPKDTSSSQYCIVLGILSSLQPFTKAGFSNEPIPTRPGRPLQVLVRLRPMSEAEISDPDNKRAVEVRLQKNSSACRVERTHITLYHDDDHHHSAVAALLSSHNDHHVIITVLS
jgi:hypothetical protein